MFSRILEGQRRREDSCRKESVKFDLEPRIKLEFLGEGVGKGAKGGFARGIWTIAGNWVKGQNRAGEYYMVRWC